MIDLHHGDCLRMAEWIEPASVNLVVTSPPYAMMRADKYGGIEPDAYPEWWMRVMDAVDYVLAPGGSIIVNWQAGVKGLRKQTWDIRSVIAMEDAGWMIRREFCWDKMTYGPMGNIEFGLPNQWERVLHVTREEELATWNLKSVRQPRVRVGARDGDTKGPSGRSSTSNVRNDPLAIPSDLLRITKVNNRSQSDIGGNHPAMFPPALPRFFIRLLSNPGDVVLDPFAGSGTTMHVALEEGRRAIGVELKDEYFAFLEKRFEKVQTTLLSEC